MSKLFISHLAKEDAVKLIERVLNSGNAGIPTGEGAREEIETLPPRRPIKRSGIQSALKSEAVTVHDTNLH